MQEAKQFDIVMKFHNQPNYSMNEQALFWIESIIQILEGLKEPELRADKVMNRPSDLIYIAGFNQFINNQNNKLDKAINELKSYIN